MNSDTDAQPMTRKPQIQPVLSALLGLFMVAVLLLAWQPCKPQQITVKVSAARAVKPFCSSTAKARGAAGLSRSPTTFDAFSFGSIEELMCAHRDWQQQALSRLEELEPSHSAAVAAGQLPGVVLVSLTSAGVGNRVPSIVTGYLMAVFSGSLLMMGKEPEFTNYMELSLNANWTRYSQYYNGSTSCGVAFDNMARGDMQWCAGQQKPNATIKTYSSNDYEVPMLQLSPTIGDKLQRLVPAGNVFHVVSTFLFRPTQLLSVAVNRYSDRAKECVLGMHVRTRKVLPGEDKRGAIIVPENYAAAARSVMKTLPGSVFVASDDQQVFERMAALLPERKVWWSEETRNTINAWTAAGVNPGSDLSAFIDIMLLSRCRHVMLTAGSSFALLAAGLSDIHPALVVRFKQENPLYNPVFWVAPTSEPCMWKAGVINGRGVANATKQIIQKHPLLLYFQQCGT